MGLLHLATPSFGLIEFRCRTEKPKSNAVLTVFDLARRRTRVRRAVRFFFVTEKRKIIEIHIFMDFYIIKFLFL